MPVSVISPLPGDELASEWLTDFSLSMRSQVAWLHDSLGAELRALDRRLDAMLGETWRTDLAVGHDCEATTTRKGGQ